MNRIRQEQESGASPVKEVFGKLADGTEIHRWSLENGGTRLKVLSYGGIVQSLEVPDSEGRYADVSLGFATVEEYVADSPYFGALIGRYGNRLGEGRFTLDGTTYELSVNDGANSLHGGAGGFDSEDSFIEILLSRHAPSRHGADSQQTNQADGVFRHNQHAPIGRSRSLRRC